MRVAYLCHDPLPDASTYTQQLISTVAELARPELRIDVIHPAASGPLARDDAFRDHLRAYYGLGRDKLGANLTFTGLGGGRFGRGPLRQAAHDFHASRHARRGPYDLHYTRDLLAVLASLAIGARVVLDTFRLNLNQMRRFLPWRRYCYTHPNFLGVLTHSQATRQGFIDAGLPAARVELAYNGHDPQAMLPRLTTKEARAIIGLTDDGRPVVGYTGHVGREKGTDTLLTLARRLPDARFLIVGGMDAALEAEARGASLSNLHCVPRVRPADIAPYLYAADVLVIPPTAGPLLEHHRTVLPMKTFSYLAAGRPILAPDLPDTREVLTDGRNAVLVAPDAAAAAADALADLLADPERGTRLALTALQDAAQYTWAGRARVIADFLYRVGGAAGADGIPRQ